MIYTIYLIDDGSRMVLSDMTNFPDLDQYKKRGRTALDFSLLDGSYWLYDEGNKVGKTLGLESWAREQAVQWVAEGKLPDV